MNKIHSIDILEVALSLAEDSGFEIRKQWLGETNTSACRIGNQWVIFLNVTESSDDQLDHVLTILAGDYLPLLFPNEPTEVDHQLKILIEDRKSRSG